MPLDSSNGSNSSASLGLAATVGPRSLAMLPSGASPLVPASIAAMNPSLLLPPPGVGSSGNSASTTTSISAAASASAAAAAAAATASAGSAAATTAPMMMGMGARYIH